MMLDIILTICTILLVIWGLYKGFIRGLMSFVTGILLYISLSNYTIRISDWMVASWGLSYGWSTVLSVISQILVISFITLVITKLIETIITSLNLSIFNRILGAVFGLLAMQFVITLFVIFMSVANIETVMTEIDKSRVCKISSHINSHYLKPVLGKDINQYLQEYLDRNREIN
ncbi:CvpA family protein [bacterium]|nr:CvpA family protein [bacterium]